MKDYRWYNCFLRDWVEVQIKVDETEAAWHSFMSGNTNIQGNISPQILSSWMRCKEKGLDPYDTSLKIISPIELEARIEKNKALINEIEPIVHEIIAVMIRALTRVDFYDSDLYLLAHFGGPKDTDVHQLGVREIPLGMSANEQDCGTMATNLCALLISPIELRAREHYRDQYSFLHDAAVPIVDQNGQLVAVLAMEAGCWPLHKYTLATLILLKRIIENRIFGNTQNDINDLYKNVTNELIERFDSAILFTDRDGRIAGANEKAKQLLFNNRRYVSGFFCDTVFGQRNSFSAVLNSKKPLVNQDFLLNTIEGVPKMFHGTIQPIIGGKGDKIQGVLGTFNEKKTKKNKDCAEVGTKAVYDFSDIIHTSSKMQQVISLAKETAKTQSNVLIQGESGTGKELFAQAIHNNSSYAEGPFMAINCSAIPAGLFESELFGYEGGAFTGAKKEGEIGKFEIASGGTIFLDEINSMPMEMQVKILRVLQQKSITRVGGTKEIPINVRIIAATNVNLWDLVMKNKFREDFYYRINIIGIVIPPLRERKEDIDILTQHILNKISLSYGHYFSISDDALELLKQYEWPGNVRELENVLERCVVLAQTKGVNIISVEEIMEYHNLRTSVTGTSIIEPIEPIIEYERQSQNDPVSSIATVEKEIICKTLKANRGNISATARELGIARNTLYRRLEKYNLDIHKAVK